MADEITAEGKYLLIEVPDFGTDTVGKRKGLPMTSFIRLGAFHDKWETQPGADLAEIARQVSTSQGGHLAKQYGGEINADPKDPDYVTGVDDERVFLDDQRRRDGADDPPPKPDASDTEAMAAWEKAVSRLPDKDKLDQSKKLFERGGWWDHSDGNRVSTTWGDKVEVIRGNYKMVVMGRQDEPANAAGWDASGGHIQDTGLSMPGASVRVEFRRSVFKDGTGTWHLENTTNNFIQTDDKAGDFFEHTYGEKLYSTTGSEHPEKWNEKLQKPYGNPHILEKTWASKIESYTGSSAWRIPEIKEETYATKTSSKTDVSERIEETTLCAGTIRSVTGAADKPVPVMQEETYAGATTSVTNVGAIVETTNCATQVSTTVAGATVEVSVVGAQEEVAIVGHHGSVEVTALTTEMTIGASFSLNLGYTRELNVGSHEDYSFPDKKKAKLKELDATLDRLHTTLIDKKVSLDYKHTALAIQLQGMLVAIGM
jgi:hypothetical protein